MKRKKLLYWAAALSIVSLLSAAIALDTRARFESEAYLRSKSEPDFLETVELESAVGMDYTELRDLLAARRWEEADAETRRVISAIGNREESFAVGLIAGLFGAYNFPCEDLRTIDRLWLKYSDRRFGFSVQLDVYRGLGGTDEYDREIWTQFLEEVGWKRFEGKNSGRDNSPIHDEPQFDIGAPKAHLPFVPDPSANSLMLGGTANVNYLLRIWWRDAIQWHEKRVGWQDYWGGIPHEKHCKI